MQKVNEMTKQKIAISNMVISTNMVLEIPNKTAIACKCYAVYVIYVCLQF